MRASEQRCFGSKLLPPSRTCDEAAYDARITLEAGYTTVRDVENEGRAIFFGTYPEMEKSPEPIIREFLELDGLKLEV